MLEILPKGQGFFSRLSFSQNLQNQAKEGRTKAAAPMVQNPSLNIRFMGRQKCIMGNRTGTACSGQKRQQEDTAMKDLDFGSFGTGDEGYAQYMTAFDRNFGGEDTDSAFASDDDGAYGDADAEDDDPF